MAPIKDRTVEVSVMLSVELRLVRGKKLSRPWNLPHDQPTKTTPGINTGVFYERVTFIVIHIRINNKFEVLPIIQK